MRWHPALSTHYPPNGVISLTLYYSHTKHSALSLAEVLSPTSNMATFSHFSKHSLIIILGVIELRSSLNWIYLPNQISTITTKQPLTLHNWVFPLQTCSLMLLASLCGTYYFCLVRLNVQQILYFLLQYPPAEIWVLLDVLLWIYYQEQNAKQGRHLPMKSLRWIKCSLPMKRIYVYSDKKHSAYIDV